MGIYEKAHELVDMLTDTEEYKEFIAAKENLNENQSYKRILENFREKQLELQVAELAGQEVEEEIRSHLDEMYQIISVNPEITEYLNAEYRFSRLISGVQKIIAESLPEWFESLEGEDMLN